MFLVSYCNSLFPIQWSQMLSREWRCSWSSANRRCSNYVWVIDNFIAHWGAPYIRDLTAVTNQHYAYSSPLLMSNVLDWDMTFTRDRFYAYATNTVIIISISTDSTYKWAIRKPYSVTVKSFMHHTAYEYIAARIGLVNCMLCTHGWIELMMQLLAWNKKILDGKCTEVAHNAGHAYEDLRKGLNVSKHRFLFGNRIIHMREQTRRVSTTLSILHELSMCQMIIQYFCQVQICGTINADT